MNDKFNPDRLVLKRSSVKQKSRGKPPRHKPGELFLRGPIPLDWLAAAAHQPGKSLHVGLGLWFLAGIKKSREIALSGSVLRGLGVKRHSGYRGLVWLEQAGLVRVVRHSGRNPIVTLLELNKSDDAEQ